MWIGVERMLKQIHGKARESREMFPIGEAAFPAPFLQELEYNSPAHGTWNIVHIGMLIPGAHQIYICTGNCNRGVVLTAAEMGESSRFSTITVKEDNILEGDMEDLIIDGVTDILEKLPEKPPVVILFPSCVHRFLGCDIPMVYRILRKRYPDICFIEGWMDCILQKAGITPDQRLRRELYSGLKAVPLNRKSVNLIGNTMKLDPDCEIWQLIRKAGAVLKELPTCKTFVDYLSMSESYLNLSLLPIGRLPAETLETRLGMKHLPLPQCFGYEEIDRQLRELAKELQVAPPDLEGLRRACEEALEKAQKQIGKTPIALDYTAVPRPLGLARLLLEHGFSVVCIYADAFLPEEKEDFDWLREQVPDLPVYSTIHVKMRVVPRTWDQPVLAIGQKAAYFTGTTHFVNMVEGGGLHGYSGIIRLAEAMTEAFETPKDTRDLIVRKGLGCRTYE